MVKQIINLFAFVFRLLASILIIIFSPIIILFFWVVYGSIEKSLNEFEKLIDYLV